MNMVTSHLPTTLPCLFQGIKQIATSGKIDGNVSNRKKTRNKEKLTELKWESAELKAVTIYYTVHIKATWKQAKVVKVL